MSMSRLDYTRIQYSGHPRLVFCLQQLQVDESFGLRGFELKAQLMGFHSSGGILPLFTVSKAAAAVAHHSASKLHEDFT